jgi:CheY-like chemotaxis protein
MTDRKIILLVDDDAIMRSTTKRILRDLAEVYEAWTGREALDLLQADLRPAVVVTDGEMPLMQGPELIEAMKLDATLANIPVLLCSGNLNLREDAQRLGVRFFEKGSDPMTLRNWVKDHL